MNSDTERLKIMESARNIVAISPHPDDAEIIAGAYMAKMRDKGSKVSLIIVSDGSKGTMEENKNMSVVRRDEQLKAASVLGIETVKFMNFPDAEVPSPGILREELLPLLRDIGPEIVVTVDPFLPYEVHPDHVNVGLGVLQSVLFYPMPNIGKGKKRDNKIYVAVSPSNRPNIVVPCDRYIEKKTESIRAHLSQALDINYILQMMRAFGKFSASEYGEPFRLMKREELHISIQNEDLSEILG